MSNSYYGGLTSQTGSVGGGGDGQRHDDDRGIFFPEFSEWLLQNGVGLATDTNASISDDGVSETMTMIIDFNDGAWRPASTIIGNEYFPKKGDPHPTIDRCFLQSISIQNQDGQPDIFRATLEYGFPDDDSASSGGGNNVEESTPLDAEFIITWSPSIERSYPEEDLDGVALRNPNSEAYDIAVNRVRLDGVCTWNQRSWSSRDLDKWTNKINSSNWTEGEYSFKKGTVLLHYVVGNLRYYSDSRGNRRPYYEMQAAISYDSNGIGNGKGDGRVKQRIQGSYYYVNSLKRDVDKRPTAAYKVQYDRYDLTTGGFLKSGSYTDPTVSNPEYQYFKLYEPVKFSFVDR